MNGIQLDLFPFAAMQIQEKSAEAKPTVVLKNFINDGKYPIPTAKSERISANLKAIRLLNHSLKNAHWNMMNKSHYPVLPAGAA